MSEQKQNTRNEDEISLKDVILKAWEYVFHVIHHWKLISLFIILGLGYNLFEYFTHVPKYSATISFMINEDESSSLGGIGGLLGSFGGLLGGASEYNLDKVLEISKSDRIAEKILLKKVSINNEVDYLANHLITSQDTLDKWLEVKWFKRPFIDYERKKAQRAYRFSNDKVDFNNRLEAYVLKQLIKLMFGPKSGPGDGIVNSEYGELTGIMKLSTSSYNESLSLNITNFLFEELSDFYIKKSVEKQQQTFDLMKMKHDSINNLLAVNEYSLAKFQDTNRGLYKISDQVKKDQYQREVFILATALGEAKKNLEISDFALRNKTPFIQVLDKPFLPLGSSKPGVFNIILIGIILGGFLGTVLVICKKIYNDIMS